LDSRHDLIEIEAVIKTSKKSPPTNHGVIVPGNVPVKLQTLFPKDKNIVSHYSKHVIDDKSPTHTRRNATEMPP
jgi:hypothetical protein